MCTFLKHISNAESLLSFLTHTGEFLLVGSSFLVLLLDLRFLILYCFILHVLQYMSVDQINIHSFIHPSSHPLCTLALYIYPMTQISTFLKDIEYFSLCSSEFLLNYSLNVHYFGGTHESKALESTDCPVSDLHSEKLLSGLFMCVYQQLSLRSTRLHRCGGDNNLRV